MDLNQLPNNLIVFDGICKFCNASINFIIRHDRNTVFFFATGQSETGTALLEHLGIDPNDPTTFVMIKDGKALTQSNAALEIAKELNAPWSYLSALEILPQRLRDIVYAFIARNRYRIWGKLEDCRIPTQELKSRFLE